MRNYRNMKKGLHAAKATLFAITVAAGFMTGCGKNKDTDTDLATGAEEPVEEPITADETDSNAEDAENAETPSNGEEASSNGGEEAPANGDVEAALNGKEAAQPKETPVEEQQEVVQFDPAAALTSAEYKAGILSRAAQFSADLKVSYQDISDDLSRFSLIDMDKDGLPELIMHDVAGKCAYYCTFTGTGMSEPYEIYKDEKDDDSSFVPGAYAALYLTKNLYIKYVITGNYDRIESYIYKVDEATKAPQLINSVIEEKNGDGEFSYMSGDGTEISGEDYCKVFSDALGGDYGRYFLDELMIADGEFDFKSQYEFNSTAVLSHMTLDELTAKMGG